MQIQNASFIHFTLEPLEEYQQICISMPYCHIDKQWLSSNDSDLLTATQKVHVTLSYSSFLYCFKIKYNLNVFSSNLNLLVGLLRHPETIFSENLPTAILNSTTSPTLREKSPCKSLSEKTISSSTSSLLRGVYTIFPCNGSCCLFEADLLSGRSTVPWNLSSLMSSNFTVPSGNFSTRTATSLPYLNIYVWYIKWSIIPCYQ